MPPRALAALLIAVAGCAAAPPRPTTPPPSPEESARLDAEGDRRFGARADRAELEAAIDAWERAASPAAEVKLARALYLYADGYLGLDGEAARPRLLQALERGVRHGERAVLAASPAMAARVAAGAEISDAVALADRGAVPALYWYGLALRSLAAARGFVPLSVSGPKVKRIMERCLELDEDYFYGGPHRYLGAFYARAPAIAGGDLKAAARHFEASLRVAPSYLATRVLWAELYAVKKEDRAGFERELRYVLDQPRDVVPEIAAENAVERRKAERLLAREKELF